MVKAYRGSADAQLNFLVNKLKKALLDDYSPGSYMVSQPSSSKTTTRSRGRPKGSKNKGTPSIKYSKGGQRGFNFTVGQKSKRVVATRRRPPSQYNIKGSVKKIENGGELSTTTLGAAYIGHGVAVNQLWSAVCRAIVRQLFLQAGQTFTDWNNTPAFAGKIGVYYVVDPASATSVSGFEESFLSSVSFADIADELLARFRADFSEANEHEFHRFYLTDDTNTNPQQVAQIMAKHLTLDVNVTSRLSMQNQTLAQNADTDVTDITNNPLIGKVYSRNKEWCNFIMPQDRTNTFMGKPFVCDADTGIFALDSADSNTQQIAKPPPAWYFNCNLEKKIKVPPGGIINNYLKFEVKKISLNKLASILRAPLASSLDDTVNFGFTNCIGLEKLLDAKRTSGTGQNISIGYEINQTYSVSANYRKYVASSPILEIGSTQLTTS